MIAIHYRTPNSLELSISAGKHVRHFAAHRRELGWHVEEFYGDSFTTFSQVTRKSMFRFFRGIEQNLLTFQKSEFKE